MKKSLLFVVLAITTLLQGDYVIKYNMDGQTMTFMYKNATTSKMVTVDEEDGSRVEIYNVKKNSYIVTYSEDSMAIINANELKAKAKQMKAQAIKMGMDPSMFDQEAEAPMPDFKVTMTGKKQKVGGVNGEVWILSGEEDGEKFKEKVVVTNNKRVIKTMRAMLKSFADLSGAPEGSNNFFEPRKGYLFIKADGMKLESFATKSLPSKTYVVPTHADVRKSFNKRKRSSAKATKEKLPYQEVPAKMAVVKGKKEQSQSKPTSSQKSDNVEDAVAKEAAKLFKSFF